MFFIHCYQYKAIIYGRKKIGYILASSEKQAMKNLFNKNYTIYSIKQVSDLRIKIIYHILSLFRLTMSRKRFTIWWLQELTDLLRSGISLPLAVEGTVYKCFGWYYKLLLCHLHKEINSGKSFSSAASKLKIFSSVEIASIRSAELNNCLLEAFSSIHDYLSNSGSNKVRQSIVLIPLFVFIAITIFVSHYLANNILNIFVEDIALQGKKLGVSSLLFTKIYMGPLAIQVVKVLSIFVGIKILYSLVFALPFKGLKDIEERILLFVPMKNKSIKKRNTVFFLSALSFALKSRLALHTAFLQASHAIPSFFFKKQLRKAYHRLYQGASIEQALNMVSMFEPGDRLVLQSSLANYGVNSEGLDNLLNYTRLQLMNFQILTSKLINTTVFTVFISLLLLTVAAVLNILFLEYF